MIQKQLTDRLALALLEGQIGEGDTVRVDAADGELVRRDRARRRARRHRRIALAREQDGP